MNIINKTILVTGANRGIGRALVEEALKRGAKRVYAASRIPIFHPDGRVFPLTLDVTNLEQVKDIVSKVDALDILVNNAGIALYDNLSDSSVLEKHLAVNLFGTFTMTQAFLPHLTQSAGVIVNNLSILAFSPLPVIPSYSISKAAAFSFTQSLRAILAVRGIKVHAAMIGPTDTDMNLGLDIPKASPETTASGIFDGLEREEEEIFPDPISASMAKSWRNSAAKAMERENAAFVAA